MGLQGLEYKVVTFAFAAGLEQKVGPQVRDAPALDIALDVQFDELNVLQPRKPFVAMGAAPAAGVTQPAYFGGPPSGGGGGGVPIADMRWIAAHDGELLLFSKDSLWSWDAANAGWIWKAWHLAVKVDEETRFATTGDQIDVDRAELNGVIVFAWSENDAIWAAALDKVTGDAIVPPTQLVASGAANPHVVALQTRILLMWSEFDSGLGGTFNLKALAIDPTNPITSFAGARATVTANATGGYAFDVVQCPGRDVAYFAAIISGIGTEYVAGTVTSALAVVLAPKARNAIKAISLSVSPDLAHVQIARVDGNNIVGDLLDLAFTDIALNQAIGNCTVGDGAGPTDGCEQITCSYRDVQDGGQYRCYVWWTTTGAGSTYAKAVRVTKSNWVDAGGTLGVAATFTRNLSVASRAFDHDGHAYVWLAFGEDVVSNNGAIIAQLEDSYFLYRDDGLLCAKAVNQSGGGVPPTIGCLPGVASADGLTYAWCGNIRRTISLGATAGGGVFSSAPAYESRSPRDITFTFDSNEARRSAKLGETVYIPAGEVLQYDGVQLAEVGFHYYPWWLYNTTAGAGTVPAGTYATKATWRWTNGKGEVDRSTTAVVAQTVIAGAAQILEIKQPSPLCTTHKTTPALAVEFWRTEANPTEDAPFFLVSDTNPYNATNPNRYIANDPTVDNLPDFEDNLTDAQASSRAVNDENDGILENLAPSAASIILATDDRLFLAGVAGEPDQVWYSKIRQDGQVAAFNDELAIIVPRPGGKITALAIMNETLVVFRERAIYALQGDGFDNTGGGDNYGPTRLISLDCGAVNHESVCWTDKGLVFKSAKGWYLLNMGWTLDYIGGGVKDYDAETPLAVHAMASQHQVRVVTPNRVLVWDHYVGQWFEWTIAGALSATVWNGTYVYLDPVNGPMLEQADYSAGVDYAMDVETAWIKLDGVQGRGYVRTLQTLGEWRASHKLRIRCARDYQEDGAGNPAYYDDVTTPVAIAGVVGGPAQVRHGPSQKRCAAIKVRLTAVAPGGGTPTTDVLRLSGIVFDAAGEGGLFQGLSIASRV